MKRCLADVNVLLALLFRRHEHHRLAVEWFERQEAASVGLCRVVQLGLVRLQASPSILGSEALSTTASWNLVAELLEGEQVEFVPEPPGLDALLPACLTHPAPAAKLVNDAYLAAFAMASGRHLVTLDRGFRQFQGLQVELLEQ